jgi:hypothetical protein
MISLGTYIISVIVSAIIGAVAGIFVYRNNSAIGKVADKVDKVKDIIKN